jgi:hypothetical protein
VYRYKPLTYIFDSEYDQFAIPPFPSDYILPTLWEAEHTPVERTLTVPASGVKQVVGLSPHDAVSGQFDIKAFETGELHIRLTAKAATGGVVVAKVFRVINEVGHLTEITYGDGEILFTLGTLGTGFTTFDLDLPAWQLIPFSDLNDHVFSIWFQFENSSGSPVDVTVQLGDESKTSATRISFLAFRFGGVATTQVIPARYFFTMFGGILFCFDPQSEGGEVQGIYVFVPFGTYVGSGGIVFGGEATAVFEPAAPVVVEDDSRGWFQRRFDITAVASGLEIKRPVVSRPVVTADATASVSEIRIPVSVGPVSAYTDVSISSNAQVSGLEIHVSLLSVSASTDSNAAVDGMSVPISMGQLSSTGDAIAKVYPFIARVRVGRASAEIGPDLVMNDDDELLFLLEVA